MKTREEVLAELRTAMPELTKRFGIRRLSLFGSYARGEQREDSDVDILVEVDPAIGLGFVDLADRIAEILGQRIELVSRRAVKPRNWEFIRGEMIDVA